MKMLDPTIFKKSECPEEILTKLAIVQKIPQSVLKHFDKLTQTAF
jgi:hypothetical protein